MRLAGGRRDSGRVRLRAEGVAGKQGLLRAELERALFSAVNGVARGLFQNAGLSEGSRQLWRGEPAGAC